MASIFFTERLPGISKWQIVSMSQPGEFSLAPSGLILASGKAGLLIIDANCDDHKLRFPTGFLKSRVYAKLLTWLISERYQTFNKRVEEVVPDTA
jgi:hypothetical protein